MALLETEEQTLAIKRRKLDTPSKRKHTTRDSTPTSLCENNSEKIGPIISSRSARRRCKETLIACKNVHGNVEGNIANYISSQGCFNMNVLPTTHTGKTWWLGLGLGYMRQQVAGTCHASIVALCDHTVV